MSTEIIVALIAMVGVASAGLPAALIERARKENATDHAFVRRRLDRIDEHLDEIEDAVDDVAETLTAHMDNKEAHVGNPRRVGNEEESNRHPA